MKSSGITRKDFLKTAAALGAYGALAGSALAQAPAKPAPFWGYLTHLRGE